MGIARNIALAAALTIGGVGPQFAGTADAVQPPKAAKAAVSWPNSYEWDTAVAGTPPATFSGGCVTMTGAKSCYETYGDKWWVLDTAADGHSATASWENYLKNDLDGWDPWRHGSCVNKLGKDHWGVCNKNYYENDDRNEYGSKGSILDWQSCIYDSKNGTWHGCSTNWWHTFP